MVARFHLRSDLRQFDEHHIRKLVLGVIGDAYDPGGRINPLMGFAVTEIGGNGNKVNVTGNSSGAFIFLGSDNVLTVNGDNLAGNIAQQDGQVVSCVAPGTTGCTFNP